MPDKCVSHSYSADDRIKMAGRLRQLAKEMTEGDPKTAAMLVQSARMIERQSPPTGPGGGVKADAPYFPAGSAQGSVGPWKECVYKHPDAPKIGDKPVAYAIQATTDGSFRDRIVPVGYTMFDVLMAKMMDDPWVKNGAARIVPLYATKRAPLRRTECTTSKSR